MFEGTNRTLASPRHTIMPPVCGVAGRLKSQVPDRGATWKGTGLVTTDAKANSLPYTWPCALT